MPIVILFIRCLYTHSSNIYICRRKMYIQVKNKLYRHGHNKCIYTHNTLCCNSNDHNYSIPTKENERTNDFQLWCLPPLPSPASQSSFSTLTSYHSTTSTTNVFVLPFFVHFLTEQYFSLILISSLASIHTSLIYIYIHFYSLSAFYHFYKYISKILCITLDLLLRV